MSTLRNSQKTALAVLMALGVSSAHAVLEREGPVSPANGYPAWYQDTSGLALEFCTPLNAAELASGWCLLLTGDTVAPEVFPTAFFDEHFYWAATADAGPAKRALLVLAVEGAFANGPVKAGDQIVFSRIRVKLNNVPVTGTYKFIHPYGEETIEATAGSRIFFTDDVGINCPPGQFQCAMEGRVGPYLLPSATPGGAEMPPVTAANPAPDTDPAHFGGATPTAYPGTGKAYIADPNRIGPVTGSPTGFNKFRVEGPPGSNLDGAGNDFVETADFALMGRIFTGSIPGRVSIDRASYARTAVGQRVDVFASAEPTRPGRLPGGAIPPATPPAITVFDTPCDTQLLNPGTVDETVVLSAPVASTGQLMAAEGNRRFAHLTPAVIPSSLCYGDSTTELFFETPVDDEVKITQKAFNQTTGLLSVTASSSDAVSPPTLTLQGSTATPNAGQFVVPTAVPPAKVRVNSSARGFDVE